MVKKVLINSLLISTIVFSVLAAVILPSTSYAQNSIVRIYATPITGRVGSQITITGENFPGTRANIYWDNAYVARDITISQDGKFTYDLTIPETSKGAHIISADDNSNWAGGKAEIEFNILPGIDIFPKVAEMQTPILIRGNGFGVNEGDIKIMVDGNIIPSPKITANNKGYWSTSYTVNSLKPGRHTITASSSSTQSSELNSESFILAPWLEVSPSSGPVGTQLMIYGWGFRHNEDGITVTWDGNIIVVNIRAEVDGTLVVDGTKRDYGNFLSGDEYYESVYVPKTTQGTHTVGVYGSSFTPRGTLPYYSFNVTPQITLNPATGHKGTYITIEGTGFAAGETVDLKYDTTEINNAITSDDTGTFSVQYIIPQSSSIDHSITADGNHGNSASAKFTMDTVDLGSPTLEAPTNGESTALFNSVGDVYINAIKYLIRLGDFISGKSNKDDSDIITYFKWNLPGAPVNAQYILQISTDSGFKNPTIEKTLSSNIYNLTRQDGLAAGTYYWRVKASDYTGAEGQWSQVYTLEITSMPTRTAIFSIVIFILIIAAIVFVVILLWTTSINKYKY